MRLTGEEIHALLGATLILGYVPFTSAEKPILSEAEAEFLAVIEDKLLRAKRNLRPPEPRTPHTFAEMLRDETDVEFSPAEARLLADIVRTCLVQLRSDADLSPHAGVGVRLEALRTVTAKLLDSADRAQCSRAAARRRHD